MAEHRAEYRHPVDPDMEFQPLWLPEMFRRTAERFPDRLFMDFMGRRYSYQGSWAAIRRVASGFRALGVGPGVSVGLFLPNCPQYPMAAYGAWLAGARVVNFSPLYTAKELTAQVADSETDVMVTVDAAALYPTIEKVLAESRLQRLIVGSIASVLPPSKAVLYRLFRRKERVAWTPDAAHVPFSDLLLHEEMSWPDELPSADSVALLQYTGGTTGVPKGAKLTHANLSCNAQQISVVDPPPEDGDRLLAALPLFHVFAHTCVMNRSVLRGDALVMLPKFDAKGALDAIKRCAVTGFPGVPTMYQALLNRPDLGEHDFSSLRVCVSGGAPLPDTQRQEFERITGASLIEGYGLTESSGVVCCNPFSGGGRSGTIGQPLPGTKVRLLDKTDPTKLAAPGESGELAFRGPQMMQGYWSAGDADVFADGYCRTGDIAVRDADGFYRIVDRLKDMLIVSGYNVFPSALEEVLYQHPAVSEALVIGVPDTYSGERPKAFVTLKDGATATPEELLAHLNAHVGKEERAIAVVIRDSLPHTLVGKLSRKELVAEERRKAAS